MDQTEKHLCKGLRGAAIRASSTDGCGPFPKPTRKKSFCSLGWSPSGLSPAVFAEIWLGHKNFLGSCALCPTFLPTGQQGPLPMLFRASEAYRTEAKKRRMDCPLRAQLLHTLFRTVLKCIKNIQEPGADSSCSKQGLDDKGGTLGAPYCGRGSPSSRAPGTRYFAGCSDQAVKQGDVIHRFNVTHQTTAEQRGTARLMLEVGLRAAGVTDVWRGLEALQGLAALQIMGMLRRDGLRRSILAEDIQKMLVEFGD